MERRHLFSTDHLLRCRCVLYDTDGGEIIVTPLSIEASIKGFGGPMIIDLHGEISLPSLTQKKEPSLPKKLSVRKVIYNPPATVVLWEDGTKTVVKCDERDEYNPDYGFALCFMKKALGNSSKALNYALDKERIKV